MLITVAAILDCELRIVEGPPTPWLEIPTQGGVFDDAEGHELKKSKLRGMTHYDKQVECLMSFLALTSNFQGIIEPGCRTLFSILNHCWAPEEALDFLPLLAQQTVTLEQQMN